MRVKGISKLKSVALAVTMLIFAVVVVLEGVAVGDEQTNVEQPVLGISKTMTSGKTTVPIKTKEYWTLEIVVTYDGQGDINKVKVDDKIPKGVELIRTTLSKGKVKGIEGDHKEKKGKKGGKITWDIGTMAPGDEETLTMELTAKFKKKGEYSLNEGATVASKVGKTKVKAGPTDPITVYVTGDHKRGRGHGMGNGGMGHGMGGMWK